VAAAVVFVAVLVIQVEVARRRSDEDWYDGRALAESAKSLAWQYAAAGGLYGPNRDVNEADCDRRFLNDLRGLLEDIGSVHLIGSADAAPQITEAMRRLRAQDLSMRRDVYLASRIGEQRRWYAGKAESSGSRRRFWLGVVLLAQVAGGAGAVLAAVGIIELDLLGIAGAFLAASVGWVQLGDYGTLASAYSVACHELGFAEEELRTVDNEDDWVDAVSDAEQAISREHRMWRAARGARGTDG
jgi:SMODS and SLOG-associating 2TM effector domain 1/SMODS and SLOG-associating 2TM effector domain 3